MIDSRTRLVAIIGTPIVQVKSPENFNRHFEAEGAGRAMIPIDLRPEQVADFIRLVRGWENLDGFVVTIPHKTAVAGLIDEMTPRAQFLGAANVVRRHPDGRLSGDMTDGEGFVRAAKAHGFSATGKSILLVGAGAAGRAIGHALAHEGPAEIFIGDLQEDAASSLVSRLVDAFPGVRIVSGEIPPRSFDLVVNASPCGMQDTDPLPVPPDIIELMASDGLAADVITSPEQTPFLTLAAKRGLKIQFGREMAKAQMVALGAAMGVMQETRADG